jgi:repressor LexA
MFDQPPAEADMQRHFRVTPPSVHQMVLGLASRQPGVARSINILIPPQDLPMLDWLLVNSSKFL